VNFSATGIEGALLIVPDLRSDTRGSFARIWSAEEFAARGLSTNFVQANASVTTRRGTLRGLHYQTAPHAEAKLVRCIRGAIYDVIVDVRPSSPTYRRWIGVELAAGEPRMLYVPPGCAHGYQTLVDDTEVFYPVTAPYTPGAEQGVRFDDPAFAIEWPLEVSLISEKDLGWADFSTPDELTLA
jgi:dTDP-4-dehydrorhamnose 3,5-epimerase